MSILWWTSSSSSSVVGDDFAKRLVIVSSAGRLFMYADARVISLLCFQLEIRIFVTVMLKVSLPRDDHINEVSPPPPQHSKEPQRIDLLIVEIACCFYRAKEGYRKTSFFSFI